MDEIGFSVVVKLIFKADFLDLILFLGLFYLPLPYFALALVQLINFF